MRRTPRASDLTDDSRIMTSRLEAAARAAAVADGVIAADPATDTKKRPDELRRGKWSPEEESYANRVIVEFKRGTIPVNEGTTLRSLLAELLKCDPMRISKKYVGQNCIGKQVYRLKLDDITPEETARYRRELIELERKFDERVLQSSKNKPSSSAKKDDRPAADEMWANDAIAANARSRSSSIASAVKSSAPASSSSAAFALHNGASHMMDFAHKTGFDTDLEKDSSAMGLHLPSLTGSTAAAPLQYSIHKQNFAVPELPLRDANASAAAAAAASTSSAAGTSSSATASGGPGGGAEVPRVTSFELFPVGEGGAVGMSTMPYSTSFLDFTSFAHLNGGSAQWESSGDLSALLVNSASDKERGHSKVEDVGLTIDDGTPAQATHEYGFSEYGPPQAANELSTEGRPPMLHAHPYHPPPELLLQSAMPPHMYATMMQGPPPHHPYGGSMEAYRLAMPPMEHMPTNGLPRNTSIDNFWLLVKTGMIPSPEEDVLRQTLWQTSKQANPTLLARYGTGFCATEASHSETHVEATAVHTQEPAVPMSREEERRETPVEGPSLKKVKVES